MEPTVLMVLLFAMSTYNLFNIARMWRDDVALTTYAETNPKAALWRKRYGVDGTKRLMRTYFMPIGGALNGVFLLIACGLLFRLLTRG